MPNTRSRALNDINKSIEESLYVIKEHVDVLCQKGDFSFAALDMRMGNSTGNTINQAFEAKITQMEQEDRIGSRDINEATLKLLEEFAEKNIPFDLVDPNWLKRCEAFWNKTKNTTSIGMHMRNLRAIMNAAKKSGIIKDSQYPFGRGKYKIKTSDSIKKALTMKQICQIYHFEHHSEALMRYKDLWLFIYFCNGLNVADLIRLKFSDIIDGEICFIRQKTARTSKNIKRIRVPLTDELSKTIDKYCSDTSKDDYLFLYLETCSTPTEEKARTKDLTKRINKYMKIVGQELGFTETITTYTARHPKCN